jgi:hypothetical protein
MKDKRIGKGAMPKVCAVTGKTLSHNEAGTKIKLANGYYTFVRATAVLSDKLRLELEALCAEAEQPTAQVKTVKKTVTKDSS